MSFDIEKRFRFVSSDDINDDVNESDYQANDAIITDIEEGEEKGLKPKKESKEGEFDEDKDKDKDKDDNLNDLGGLGDDDDDDDDDDEL